jgi:hypothetical protein
MTSVLRATSQNSRAGSHFLSVLAAGTTFLEDATQGTVTHLQGLTATSAANGLLRADGALFVIDTHAHAVSLVTAGISSYSTTTTAPVGSVFRDVGKNIHVLSQGNTYGVAEMVATLTRVELVLGAGTEGESVRTGYIVTFSAQPTKSAGSTTPAVIPVTVARIGFGHAF